MVMQMICSRYKGVTKQLQRATGNREHSYSSTGACSPDRALRQPHERLGSPVAGMPWSTARALEKHDSNISSLLICRHRQAARVASQRKA